MKPRPRWIAPAVALTALAFLPNLWADDLRGSDDFLCAASQATQCFPDGECLTAPSWELNIPSFVRVDLEAKKLATTEASGQNRETPIENLEREGGYVYLQGIEGGRAFSFVIAEETGTASIGVVHEGMTVTVFAVCTPTPSAD